jgi:predicted neutral ceramidase superfamily lipid hydrolase
MKNTSFPGTDERTVSIIHRVCAVLYVLTIAALWIDLVVREFVLKLPVSGYHDIAMIFTANVLLLVGAIIYYGGVVIPRIRPAWLAAIYAVAVLLGTTFTVVKYRLTSLSAVLDKFKIVASILGVLVVAYALLAYLGNRRMERETSS